MKTKKGNHQNRKPNRAGSPAAKIRASDPRLKKYGRLRARLKARIAALEALGRGEKPFEAVRAYIRHGGLRSPNKLFYAFAGCSKERVRKLKPAERELMEKGLDCAWLSRATVANLADANLVCETLVRIAANGLAPLESDAGVINRVVITAARAYWKRRSENQKR